MFGELAKQGYIYRGLKPIHWCINDETALAEAEIEYADHASPSIYVRFPLVTDPNGLFADSDKAQLHDNLDHHAVDDPGEPGRGRSSGL